MYDKPRSLDLIQFIYFSLPSANHTYETAIILTQIIKVEDYSKAAILSV